MTARAPRQGGCHHRVSVRPIDGDGSPTCPICTGPCPPLQVSLFHLPLGRSLPAGGRVCTSGSLLPPRLDAVLECWEEAPSVPQSATCPSVLGSPPTQTDLSGASLRPHTPGPAARHPPGSGAPWHCSQPSPPAAPWPGPGRDGKGDAVPWRSVPWPAHLLLEGLWWAWLEVSRGPQDRGPLPALSLTPTHP